MDLNQLIIAAIGASSTLLAAWLTTRAKQKPGVSPTRKSARRTLVRFAIYFLLGGAATYWAMNWLLPFGQIDERLSTLESNSQSLMERIGGTARSEVPDSIVGAGLPVGSVILSMLPPDQFEKLPGASALWVPADGRTLDSLSLFAILTGSRRIPDMRSRWASDDSPESEISMDSLRQRLVPAHLRSGVVDTSGRSLLYWYVRIN